MSNAEEVQAGTNLKAHIKMEVKHDLVGNTELVGCYVHPMPVLSVLLNTREDEIHICVLCGLLVDKDTILFIYKVTIKEPRLQSPTFVGYTPIILPTLKDRSGGEVSYYIHAFREFLLLSIVCSSSMWPASCMLHILGFPLSGCIGQIWFAIHSRWAVPCFTKQYKNTLLPVDSFSSFNFRLFQYLNEIRGKDKHTDFPYSQGTEDPLSLLCM